MLLGMSENNHTWFKVTFIAGNANVSLKNIGFISQLNEQRMLPTQWQRKFYTDCSLKPQSKTTFLHHRNVFLVHFLQSLQTALRLLLKKADTITAILQLKPAFSPFAAFDIFAAVLQNGRRFNLYYRSSRAPCNTAF